jgi:hypothetical protein
MDLGFDAIITFYDPEKMLKLGLLFRPKLIP